MPDFAPSWFDYPGPTPGTVAASFAEVETGIRQTTGRPWMRPSAPVKQLGRFADTVLLPGSGGSQSR